MLAKFFASSKSAMFLQAVQKSQLGQLGSNFADQWFIQMECNFPPLLQWK